MLIYICKVYWSIAVQIELDVTTLDAAKSSIVYGVTKNVSTAGRAVCKFVFFRGCHASSLNGRRSFHLQIKR